MDSADPRLLAAATRARELGQAHGWGPATTRDVLDGLAVLLEPLGSGEKLTLSQVRARRLGTRRLRGIHRITEVLGGMGLLADDTAPAIRAWVERRAGELPPGFAGPVHGWLLVLLDGDTGARPRSPATVYRYLNAVAPILAQWASTHDHLREITLGAQLRERGVGLHVIDQGIDTSTMEGRAMFGMLSVLAELQRELIVANTNDGLAAARARGRTGGRRPKLSPDQATLAQQLYDARQKTVQQIADLFNVPRSTVYGHLDRDKTVPRQPKKTAAKT